MESMVGCNISDCRTYCVLGNSQTYNEAVKKEVNNERNFIQRETDR